MNEFEKLIQDAELAVAKFSEHQKLEQKFAEQASHRFSENISAFEQYYPEIAKAITAHIPSSDFRIHVTPSGHGNYVPRNSDVPLYGDNPLETVHEQIEKNVKSGYYSLTNYGFGAHDDDPRIHVRYMNKLDEEIKKLNAENAAVLTELPAHFPSAMIFGIGLGYHLTELLNKHSFDYIFVCEPDFELFYASLFCTDWAEIIERINSAGQSLFIQVGVSYQDFFRFLTTISNTVGVFSFVRCFCYQHYPSIEVNELIKTFFDRYIEFQLGFGFYNDALTGLSHVIHHIQNKCSFYIQDHTLAKKYANIPVFVVGNGPSLDESYELLLRNKDSAIIIAAGTALNSLLKMGITPDFHVLVERTKSTYDVLIDTLPADVYAELNLLTVDVMYPDALDLYKWSGVALKGPEAATTFVQFQSFVQHNYLMPSMPYCGPMVSNLAVSYALQFGFSDIYLMGINNGSVDKKTHSKFSIYYDAKNRYGTALTNGSNRTAEGNLGLDVKTTDLLYISKKQLESLISGVKNKYIYNVGHGAKIEGAYPLSEDMVMDQKPIQNKKQIVEQIKNDFFKSGFIKFDESMLQISFFEDMCQHIIDISSEKASTRVEASKILKRQSAYLYAHDSTAHTHLFHMLKGSMSYYHCPIVTLLYRFEDDELTMAYFHKFMQLWIGYLTEMKNDFRLSWNKKCEAGLIR